jgi:AraC-like DNA-binding protein
MARIGITSAAWIEQVRVSAARRLLELGREAPKKVAVHCGYANAVTLRRAFTTLRSCRPGPVILAIPNATATYDETADPYRPVKGWKSAPDPADVRAAVDQLLEARNPLVYAGEGVIYAGASEELKALAELVNVPVIRQRGVPGESSPVRRRARRSAGTLPEQKRPHPRLRLEPVAAPLQPRHS